MVHQSPLFLAYKNLKPFISDELSEVLKTPIRIFTKQRKSNPTKGLKQKLFLKFVMSGYKPEKLAFLKDTQLEIAAKCEILMRALAHVGIIALIDEATGYQYDRERDELSRLLGSLSFRRTS